MCAALILLAGCGGDDEKSNAVTVIERTVTETTPAREPLPEACRDVTLTENSGDGAFGVLVKGISCADAANLLRSDSGLTSWDCRSIEQFPEGNERFRCRDGEREIAFTTGL